MNPVRPNIWANVPPPGQGVAKSAAQRAFFDAALGKAAGGPQQTQGPVATSSPAQTRATPQPVQRVPADQPAEPPNRILRPGSLLDIRV